MDKLKMHSMNKVDENIKKIGALFPNCVTEVIKGYTTDEKGKEKPIIEYAIDFDMLKQELSSVVVEGKEERYQFTWPDKKKSILAANAPITKTLRPVRVDETVPTGEDSNGKPYLSSGSVDFDNTQNLYIEGDNLAVLKLLQETYLGKIKLIYIDPPYNTGNDFVYNDDFAESAEEYLAHSGQFDEDGNRFVPNLESNGRFHTDWLNMMYSRIRKSKDLLSEDGIIFISIGQAEIHNLTKICDEIFGESNHIGSISRVMKSGGAQGQFFSPNMEYILVYAKNITEAGNFRQPITEEIINKLYTSVETEGARKGEKYRPFGLFQASLDPLRGCSNQRYYIEAPDGTLLIPPGNVMPDVCVEGASVVPKTGDDKVWRWSKDRYLEEKQKGNIVFKKSKGVLIDSNGNPAEWNVYTKIWLNDRQDEGMVPVDLITKWENRQSKKDLQALGIPFDFAKPVDLIKFLINIVDDTRDSIILDFFSGSATTAHAVMQLNVEDNGNRKFVMVQIPEETETKSEAYKAGYKNICEIGKERIRRAGAKIKEENGMMAQNLDIGFRVLKLDSSNMQEVYYNPSAMTQSLLDATIDNVKSDRTPLDLLFQVMLDLGIELSAKIDEHTVNGKTYYAVNDNDIIACFDDNIDNDVITAIAKKFPLYAVFKDKSFATDSVGINNEQLFKTYSPSTVVKVI